jgi:hypothetical protein
MNDSRLFPAPPQLVHTRRRVECLVYPSPFMPSTHAQADEAVDGAGRDAGCDAGADPVCGGDSAINGGYVSGSGCGRG